MNCMMRCIWIVGMVRWVRMTLVHFRMFILVRLLVLFWLVGRLIPVWLVIGLLMDISRSWFSMIRGSMGMNWGWFCVIRWLMGMNWSWFCVIRRFMGMNWSWFCVVSRLMMWAYWSWMRCYMWM